MIYETVFEVLENLEKLTEAILHVKHLMHSKKHLNPLTGIGRHLGAPRPMHQGAA